MYKECDIIMIPTNEKADDKTYPSLIALFNDILYSCYSGNYNYHEAIFNNLYILSNDKIEEGDWWINLDDNKVTNNIFWMLTNNAPSCKKIIATTDTSLINDGFRSDIKTLMPSIPQLFIDKFIAEYNKGNLMNKIMVEYKEKYVNSNEDIIDVPNNFHHIGDPTMTAKQCADYAYLKKEIIKISENNTIFIKNIKDSWNRDEVISIVKCAIDNAGGTHIKSTIDKWIEENL